jgi:hypothetical protein
VLENKSMKTCRGNASKGEFIWEFISWFQPVFSRGKEIVSALILGREK